MGTFSAIKNKNQSAKDMNFTIQYMVDIKKTFHDGIFLNSGINCSVQSAHFEMMTTKNRYRKADKRMFYQFVQSFPTDTKLTPQEVHQIGLEFAQKQFPQFEVLISTHCNTKNLHNHILVNSVSFETGKKLHQNHDNLLEHRHINDEICMKFGEQPLKPYVKGQKNKGMSSREYRSAMKGESYKLLIANTIDDCMKFTQSKEHFIYLMESEGFKMRWEKDRNSITFTTPLGRKARDNNLHEDKYLKGNIENELRIRESFFRRTETANRPQRTATPPMVKPLTIEDLKQLQQNQTVFKDALNWIMEDQKLMCDEIVLIRNQVKNLPTATDLQKISAQLTELKTMLEQAGKPKEKSYFMAKFKLPKLRCPQVEWSPMWLLIIPMLLPLWVILSALVGLWNRLQTMLQ